jgi:hypothetical protein
MATPPGAVYPADLRVATGGSVWVVSFPQVRGIDRPAPNRRTGGELRERSTDMLAAIGGLGIVGIIVVILIVLAVLYFARRA